MSSNRDELCIRTSNMLACVGWNPMICKCGRALKNLTLYPSSRPTYIFDCRTTVFTQRLCEGVSLENVLCSPLKSGLEATDGLGSSRAMFRRRFGDTCARIQDDPTHGDHRARSRLTCYGRRSRRYRYAALSVNGVTGTASE
jgi:hypothetical protein